MIAAVQVRGHIGARQPVKDTLKMLNLGKKFACTIVEDNPVNNGMLTKCRDFITYGPVSKDTEESLKKIMKGKTANLHPPRGGMKSIKRHFPKGDLGARGEAINDLIVRMLP